MKSITLVAVALAFPVVVGVSGCGTTSNSLTGAVTQKGMELAGYGAGAVVDKVMGPKAEEEEMALSGDAILVKADESCKTEQLSEADCARLKESALKMTALAMNVQNLDTIAKESRAKQRAAALNPVNILRDVGGAAVGHQVMLERIGTINGGAGMKLP